MIEIESLAKRYRSASGRHTVDALDDLTLSVARGEVMAIIGPNGAGKTTLLAALLGFIRPTSGTIGIAGSAPRTYVRLHGASYVPERVSLPGRWRIRSALRALARLEGLDRAAARLRADALIDRFGLEAVAGREARFLSHGMLQRVGLAQALLARRELVVLDEPGIGLDPLWRMQLRELLLELRAEGRTVLIASHDLAELERIASRAALLENGRVRELIELEGAAGDTRYRLRLRAPTELARSVFPALDALRHEDGTLEFTVRVADPLDLSIRLAALLDAGAVLIGVWPQVEHLEERVRRTLDREAGSP
ncbi:MAG: ABC transporter ATP-binding protein [Longimicrobiales bacterium]